MCGLKSSSKIEIKSTPMTLKNEKIVHHSAGFQSINLSFTKYKCQNIPIICIINQTRLFKGLSPNHIHKPSNNLYESIFPCHILQYVPSNRMKYVYYVTVNGSYLAKRFEILETIHHLHLSQTCKKFSSLLFSIQ